MPADEYAALRDDIKTNGQLEPIWTLRGEIIDGRHRYRACQELGIDPTTREWRGTGSVVNFVISENLRRRHLTASQRAAIAVDMLPLLEAEAEQRRNLGKKIDQGQAGRSREQAADLVGTNQQYVADAKRLAAAEPDLFQQVKDGEKTIGEAKREENKRHRVAIQAHRAAEPTGLYQTLVVDPPWPMEKIERDARPAQVGFDYPAMTEDELAAFPIPDWAEVDAHLYLWTTHKHLPMALRLATAWGFRYECLLTWVKNVGFTPYSWMRSTEHVLFCRRGNLELLQLGLRLDFNAKVVGHSVKPDAFYELVERASPGPRIDVFARKQRQGWDIYGNEAPAA